MLHPEAQRMYNCTEKLLNAWLWTDYKVARVCHKYSEAIFTPAVQTLWSVSHFGQQNLGQNAKTQASQNWGIHPRRSTTT